jgi:hypothetical protein
MVKTHVRTHLRRKKHGKAIVRYHKRRILGRRMKIDISKKQPNMILYPESGRGLTEFVVPTPSHLVWDEGNASKLRKEAKKQFREGKWWNDQIAEEESTRTIPAFFDNSEPVSIEYVVLGNKIPIKAKRIIV